MKRFLMCTFLLAVVPMAILNPLGRPAFLGYYLGVFATWLAFSWAFAVAKRGASLGA
jgi:hypothetical protein